MPTLLDVLPFHGNNDVQRPVMQALALLERHRDSTLSASPRDADVPLDGVVKDAWRDLVDDEKPPGRITRLSCEVCRQATVRDKVRCKEVWGQGAPRSRTPDEDLSQAFGRRQEYDAAFGPPRDAPTCVETRRRKREAALTAFTAAWPSHPTVKLLTSTTGKGRSVRSPSDLVPEAPHRDHLKAALRGRWPMTNVLDSLQDTELRVGCTDVFRTVGVREVRPPAVLRRRVLLALYGLGTHAGLKRVSRGGGADSDDEVLYMRRTSITPAPLRAAMGRVPRHRRGAHTGPGGRGHDGVCERCHAVRGVGPASPLTRSTVPHPTSKAWAALGKALKTRF